MSAAAAAAPTRRARVDELRERRARELLEHGLVARAVVERARARVVGARRARARRHQPLEMRTRRGARGRGGGVRFLCLSVW